MTDYTVNGSAICAHETIRCGSYISGNYFVTGVRANAFDPIACPFTLGILPDGEITQWETSDIVSSVWADIGQLTLDDATVEFDIYDPDGALYSTKSTTDYSVITFGNTLVVHINAGELLADSTMSYIATITTSDDLEYSMTGQLFVSETSTNTCFKTDVNIFERPITIINAFQRDAIKVIPERTTPKIPCNNEPPIIPITERAEIKEITERDIPAVITCNNAPEIKPITERTPDIIIIAPCGKRIGA